MTYEAGVHMAWLIEDPYGFRKTIQLFFSIEHFLRDTSYMELER